MSLRKVAKSKYFGWMVGFMGVLTIPLLIYNLWMAEAVDKIGSFVDLVTMLLLFGVFIELIERKRSRK